MERTRWQFPQEYNVCECTHMYVYVCTCLLVCVQTFITPGKEEGGWGGQKQVLVKK